MSLQEQLDALREQAKTRIAPDAQAVMHRTVTDLRASGMLTRVPKVGDRAPEFTLPNASGQPVSLSKLLRKGPVVVSFYRGRW